MPLARLRALGRAWRAAPGSEGGGGAPSRGRRALGWALAAFLAFAVLPTLGPVRSVLAWPLIAGDAEARGDAAYVMMGGSSYQERLHAASDLYHMGRVRRIYLLEDQDRSRYGFVEQRSLTRSEWAVSTLVWLGVPADRVTLVPERPGLFGSMREADIVKAALPADVRRLVVVTSPVHTRRCGLAFRRRLPPGVEVTTYAATHWEWSAEAHAPLWLEYVKLAVYFVVA